MSQLCKQRANPSDDGVGVPTAGSTEGATMSGQHAHPGTANQQPARPLRRLRTAVAVGVIVATGALGTTTGFARANPKARTTPVSDQSVMPSKQVMREMRAVIIALYGHES
jgi:hypothetical protein